MALPLAAGAAPAPDDIVVTAFKGDVRITSAGAELAPGAGAVVALAAEVHTGTDGSIDLRQGETTIGIGPDTRLEFPAQADPGPIDRVSQKLGNAYYSVGPRGSRKMSVETPYLVAVIKGTQFNVAVTADSSTISLHEGRLEILATDGAAAPVTLNAGEVAVRRKDEGSIRVIKVGHGMTASPGAGAPEGDSPTDNEGGDDPGPGSPGMPATPADFDIPTSADIGIDAGTDLDGDLSDVAGGVEAGIDLGTVGADLGADAGIDLGTVGADVTADAGIDLGTVGADVTADAGIDLGSGSVDVGAGAGVDAGAVTVDTGIAAGVDLGGGSMDAAIDAGVDAGAVSADAGVDAAADLGAGTVDLGIDAGVDLGDGGDASVGTVAGVDAGSGTVDAGVDAGVAGADVGVDAGVDLTGPDAGVDVGVNVLGTEVDLGIGGADAETNSTATPEEEPQGGILGGILSRPRN